MNAIASSVRGYVHELTSAWDRFWFSAVDPATLSAIRIAAGAMLLYTHLVWSLDLEAFYGHEGFLSRDLMLPTLEGRYSFSYFWLIESPAVLWTVHIAGLLVFALLTIGWHSRVMSVLAYFIAISYANRVVPGAFFGLDKINCMPALYLMLGPSGARYSLDSWLARRRAAREGVAHQVAPSVGANVAVRLIQLHMCIIYLFSGLEKLLGYSWWDGTAVWMSVANLEYQSIDMTWLARWPKLTALLTHVTVFWELFYSVLVWQKLFRPLVLLTAVAVHGGIALCLGMATFGLVMLIGNMAFLSPSFVRRVLERGHNPAAG